MVAMQKYKTQNLTVWSSKNWLEVWCIDTSELLLLKFAAGQKVTAAYQDNKPNR